MNAQIVSFNFTGTLSSVFDAGTFLSNDFQAGQAISGTVSYDVDEVTDFFPADPENGVYRFTGAALGGFSMAVSVTTPGHTYVFQSVISPVNLENQVQVYRPAGQDLRVDYAGGDPLLDGGSMPPTANGSFMSLVLVDPSRTALPNDSIPSTMPVHSAYGSSTWSLYGRTTGGVDVYALHAEISNITAVPEPAATGTAIGVGLAGIAFWRRIRKT